MITTAQRGAIKLAFRAIKFEFNRQVGTCRTELDAARCGIKFWIACVDEPTFRSPVQMRGSSDGESRVQLPNRLIIQ